mgnify:CR=1 FL=1
MLQYLFKGDDCRILQLERETEDLLRCYLLNFVHPEVVNSSDDVTEVDYKLGTNQKDDSDLSIGIPTKRFLASIEEELDNATIDKFHRWDLTSLVLVCVLLIFLLVSGV